MTRPRLFISLLITGALAVTGCGGGSKNVSSSTTPQVRPQPNSVAATRAQLLALSRQVGHQIYWAGTKHGYTYELTRTKDGNIYVRYLPPGVPVGVSSSDFTAIGTYPQADPMQSIQEAKKRPGETVVKLRGGGTAVIDKTRPNSVYFAYPGSKLLVEVYDPSAAHAKKLVVSGKVTPLH
jgi:hypothetical protein